MRKDVGIIAMLVATAIVSSVVFAIVANNAPSESSIAPQPLWMDSPRSAYAPAARAENFAQEVVAHGGRNLADGSVLTPDALLADAAASLGGTANARGRVAGKPADVVLTDDPYVLPPATVRAARWAYISVDVPSWNGEIGPNANRGLWEANLVVGALREEMHVRQLPPLFSSVVSAELPNGKRVEAGGGMGLVVPGQIFPSPSARAAEAEVRETVRALGLKAHSVEILLPIQPAPAVVAETDDPAAFVDDYDANLDKLLGSPIKYEGFYFELRDRDGSLALVTHSAFRIGVSTTWMRPDLQKRFES